MEIDFHYYATFAAARLAGFDAKDAGTIAHASQYVDDSSLERLMDEGSYTGAEFGLGMTPQFRITAFTPIPTVHTDAELLKLETAATWTTGDINEIRRVWSVFHFLPGNYVGNREVKDYRGSKSWDGLVFKYDDDAARDFKLMCLPNSVLVDEMINESRENFSTAHNRLHLAGIRMHILADTWAHCYYAGTPDYWINDAGERVSRIDPANGDRSEIKYYNAKWGGGGAEWSTPPSLFVRSVSYLGHGRMGHVPDYPWLKYEYVPRWSDRAIIKDNPEDYLKGFCQMVAALRSMRANKPFRAIDSYGVSDEIRNKIGGIIKSSGASDVATNADGRARVWLESLAGLEIEGIRIGTPPVYDPDVWLRQAKANFNDGASDYYRFNLAARSHLDFVAARLKALADIDIKAGNDGLVDDFKVVVKKVTHPTTLVVPVARRAFDFGKQVWRSVFP